MVSSLSGAWQRVRGHGLRQAIGALLFGTYTAILWRIYPESKFWPDAHNFQRRQWIEGCLWGAIAAVSLNASCLGNIGKKSFERGLGTFVGGWLGFLVALARIHKLRGPWGSLASGLFASVALCALGTRTSSRFVLALVGAWLGYAGSVFFEMEFWFVAWAAVATYVAYYLGEISRLGGAGRLGMIAFFVVHWGVLDARNCLFIAASRIACIELAIVQLALLSVLICPEVASERAVGSVRAALEAAQAFAAEALCAGAAAKAAPGAPRPAAGETESASVPGGGGDVELARPAAPERVPSFSKEGLKPLVGPAPARGWAGALGRLCRRAPAAEQAAHVGSAADPGPLGGGGGWGVGGGVAERERRLDMPAAEAAAAAAFRAALERMASNSATAVSEWYLGAWHGRHWYLPTVTWMNERKQRRGTFHLPERELRAFAAAARRAVGSLEGLRASLGDAEDEGLGHSGASTELWQRLRGACVAFFEELAEHCPREGASARALVPAARLAALQSAARAILVHDQARAAQPERASASAPGAEEAPAGADACCQLSLTPTPALAARTAEQRPPASEASALVRSSTAAGTDALLLDTAGAGAYVAAMRRAAAHFHLAQLAAGAGALHAAVNALLPRLPGAAIAACEP